MSSPIINVNSSHKIVLILTLCAQVTVPQNIPDTLNERRPRRRRRRELFNFSGNGIITSSWLSSAFNFPFGSMAWVQIC